MTGLCCRCHRATLHRISSSDLEVFPTSVCDQSFLLELFDVVANRLCISFIFDVDGCVWRELRFFLEFVPVVDCHAVPRSVDEEADNRRVLTRGIGLTEVVHVDLIDLTNLILSGVQGLLEYSTAWG